tara:strand:+ start:1182 stop:2018 length:837 start_codon:yes stop_codon:yes gene_type:complete
MNQGNNNDLISLYTEAVKTGDADLIRATLVKATEESKLAMSLFAQLGAGFPDVVTAHCKSVPEMPAVYSCDDSRNKMVASVARELELGTEIPFRYTGDRRKGMESKLAVERVIEIIGKLKECVDREPSILNSSEGVLFDVMAKIHALPELNQNTIDSWSSAIVDYAMTWNAATDEDKSTKFSMSFPLQDLMTSSVAYAESRLESRRNEKLKNLENRYAEGGRLNTMVEDGKPILAKEAIYLTKYQVELKNIESMEFDADCWKYAIGRLVTEKLKRMMR